MAKSKNRKDHSKRVAARNAKISSDKKKFQNFQRDYLEKLIKQEQEKGLYENLPSIAPITDINLDGPVI